MHAKLRHKLLVGMSVIALGTLFQGNVRAASISEAQAKSIALKDAGYTESQVKKLKVRLDRDDDYDDHDDYDVTFIKGKTKYEYDIDASTGDIESVEKKQIKKKKTVTGIGKKKAEAIAIKAAGVSRSSLIEIETEYDKKGYYEVSFEDSAYEYDYDIDAKTGKIIKQEKETRD